MKLSSSSGLVMAGCILIGVSVGMLFDRPEVFVPLGVGVGLIAMALIRSQYDNNRNRNHPFHDHNEENH
ncbi:MAG: hypothetical protein K6T85_18305 [Gorillibacterium sp.]|nr:hypothetical protein [Gorillibacterium sp.]